MHTASDTPYLPFSFIMPGPDQASAKQINKRPIRLGTTNRSPYNAKLKTFCAYALIGLCAPCAAHAECTAYSESLPSVGYKASTNEMLACDGTNWVSVGDGSSSSPSIPIKTTAERNAMSATTGTVIYNSTANTIEWYNGTNWYRPGSSIMLYPSCKAILDADASTGDGTYLIDPAGDGIGFSAYCDMTTDGGGWTRVYYSTVNNITISAIQSTDWASGSSYSHLYSMRNQKSGSAYEFYITASSGYWLQFTQTNAYNENPNNNDYTKIDGTFTFNGTGSWYGLAFGTYGNSGMQTYCTLANAYEGDTWWNCLQSNGTNTTYNVGPWQKGSTYNTWVAIYQR